MRNIRNFSECEQKKEDAILKYIFNSFILWLLLCDNKNDFNTTPTQQRKRVYFREAILKNLFHMMAKDSSKFFFFTIIMANKFTVTGSFIHKKCLYFLCMFPHNNTTESNFCYHEKGFKY